MKNISIKDSREISGGTGILDGVINWVRTTILGQEPPQNEPTVGDCFNQGDDQ